MPKDPSASEYERARTAWEQFTDRQQMAADVSDETDPTEPTGTVEEPDSSGDSDAEQETKAEGGGAPPDPTDGEAEIELVINETAAQRHHQQEEEFQNQLEAGDEGHQVQAVDQGLRIHYVEEDHDAVQATKAELIGEEPGSMWDFFENGDPPEKMLSDREDYDRVWLVDISADDPFGPFSPTKYTVKEIIEELSGRVEDDVLLVSDVWEVE